MLINKSDYIRWRECSKNAWLKIHRPDIFYSFELSDFEKGLMKTGNEVDKLSQRYIPDGKIFHIGDVQESKKVVEKRVPVLYHPVFETDKYRAICDILVLEKTTGMYHLYEVKASTIDGVMKTKKKREQYTYDVEFQKQVLLDNDVPLADIFLLLVNNKYVFDSTLNVPEFFIPLKVDGNMKQNDTIQSINEDIDDIRMNMEEAYFELIQSEEPIGPCACLYKPRKNHCLTSIYSIPNIPEYSVHDIVRIKTQKIQHLIDNHIIAIEEVPVDFSLTNIQKQQVDTAQSNEEKIDIPALRVFIKECIYPLAFLDYETCPLAVPCYNGYHPYDQIPFQFSLHILYKEGTLEHKEFIHMEDSPPDLPFLETLTNFLTESGSIFVWNQQFELGINKDLARRNPKYIEYVEAIRQRVVDLIVPFKQLHWVHPAFKGKTSIKYVLPAIIHSLSYKDLEVQDGAAAAETWKKIAYSNLPAVKKETLKQNLLDYCKQDTKAMYLIYKEMEKRCAT